MSVFLGRDTVTVIHRSAGAPDLLGVPARVETATTVTGCSVQPLSTQEEISNVDDVITRWKLWAPATTTVTVIDAVQWAGAVYEVDGDPQTWCDARGVPQYLTCLLRRATG